MRNEPQFVVVPASTTVADTRRVLEGASTDVAFVTFYGRVVGVITAEELDAPLVEDEEPVGDVVENEIVHVPPTADLDARLKAYRAAAWEAVQRRSPERARRLAARMEERAVAAS